MPGRKIQHTLRPLSWLGDSRKKVQEFPQPVRQDIGASLYDVQRGVAPPKAKPVSLPHVFQKKSPRGRKTAKPDIELIKKRYKEALEVEGENRQ